MVGKRELEPENDTQGNCPAKNAESKAEEMSPGASPPMTKKAKVGITKETESAKADKTTKSLSGIPMFKSISILAIAIITFS